MEKLKEFLNNKTDEKKTENNCLYSVSELSQFYYLSGIYALNSEDDNQVVSGN